MEKNVAENNMTLATKRKQLEDVKTDKVGERKKSKLEEKHEEKKSNSETQKEKKISSFEAKYEQFLKENSGFFSLLAHENSVLLVKNSAKNSFGNYENYYGLRHLKKWEDARIDLLKPEWIQGKKCLDVGCNEGIFTILLALKYSPEIIIGCDIDYTLINKAIKNLEILEKNSVNLETLKKQLGIEKEESPESIIAKKREELIRRLEKLPKSLTHTLSLPQGIINEGKSSMKAEEIKEHNKQSLFPENIIFRQENYVADIKSTEKFDVISCLSTAKWIHLNYGDVGVKALFYKAYNCLNDGGLFILEPQPMKSYKKKKYLSPQLKENYKKLKFLPHQFEEFLIDDLGFKLMGKLLPKLPTKKGYDRPIFILQKPQKKLDK